MITNIKISNCFLRPFEKGDQNIVLEMRNQDHVRENMINQDFITKKTHVKWFEIVLNSKDKAYYIFEYKNKTAGVVGFFNIHPGELADWSFYLTEGDWPKGLGTQMCYMGLSIFFEKLNTFGIETNILPNNKKSISLHEKLGFK